MLSLAPDLQRCWTDFECSSVLFQRTVEPEVMMRFDWVEPVAGLFHLQMDVLKMLLVPQGHTRQSTACCAIDWRKNFHYTPPTQSTSKKNTAQSPAHPSHRKKNTAQSPAHPVHRQKELRNPLLNQSTAKKNCTIPRPPNPLPALIGHLLPAPSYPNSHPAVFRLMEFRMFDSCAELHCLIPMPRWNHRTFTV